MQGDTVAVAVVVIGEHSGAASAYVGMIRGRSVNTAHLIADDLAEAREQWIAIFGRNRADLGPTHAAELAAREAAHYAPPRPLEEVLADLNQAWTAEQRCLDGLAIAEPLRDELREIVAFDAGYADRLAAREAQYRIAALVSGQTREQADAIGAVVATEADRIRDTLLHRWDGERDVAYAAAKVVLDGPGRLGFRRAAVARAGEQLADWANSWRPHLPDLPSDTRQVAQIAGWFDDRPALWTALDGAGRRRAERSHPELAPLRTAADAARHEHERVRLALAEDRRQREDQLAGCGALASSPDPAGRLADVDRDIVATNQVAAAQARVAQLAGEPAILSQPPGRLAQERDGWWARRDAARTQRPSATPRPVEPAPGLPGPRPQYRALSAGRPGDAPGVGR